MSHSPDLTTLDLHGKRLDDAISEVTIFLERIRRTVGASSRGRLGGNNILFVNIITGSGAHSPHGPILRTAVQKLLQKRVMNFKLEQGGAVFKVDALSGWDLHDSGPATESKVIVAEREEFHQLASARRRRNNTGNFAHAAMAQCNAPSSRRPRRVSNANRRGSSGPPRTVSNANHSSSSNPIPSQVASEDADIRTATQLSIGDSQRQRHSQHRMTDEYEREYQRAVSVSQLDYAAPKWREEEAEEEESQLKMALKVSVVGDQHHQQLTEKEYEDALMLAMEQSTQEASKASEDDHFHLAENQYQEEIRIALEKSTHEKKCTDDLEDDLIQQALAKSNTSEDILLEKEDEFLKKALAESLLEEESRKAYEQDLLQEVQLKLAKRSSAEVEEPNTSEDELLEKALAESLLEEERWKASEHNLTQEAQSKSLEEEEEMLKEIIRLSLEQEKDEAMSEEDAMRKAIEMSKQFC